MRTSTWLPTASTFLFGFLVSGTWGEHLISAQETQNPFTTAADQREGERLFRSQCGTCHGRDARGNEEGRGPNLTTGRFDHATDDAGLFTVIREGLAGTAMIGINRGAADKSIWQIVAFLNSFTVDPTDVELRGRPAAGQRVFSGKGNCTSCHMVSGQGGRLGPDLSRVGERRDPDELLIDLVDPDAQVDPRWWTIKVTQEDGSVIEGLRMSEDTFTFRLIDADAKLWSFSKPGVHAYERIENSTMPSVEPSLSISEIDDLVAYLFSLRKES